MASNIIKINGIHCFVHFTILNNQFIKNNTWIEINHCQLFSIIKWRFSDCYLHVVHDKCYCILMAYKYILEIKEYEYFINKYCFKEDKVNWRQDGF